MKIAIINVPFETPWYGQNAWITVPPQGYGGIQWNVANLIDGLLELHHEIFLLGAPGSQWENPAVHVIDAGEPDAMRTWLQNHRLDVIHDFSNSAVGLGDLVPTRAYVSTHHFTGRPNNPTNAIYVSVAQRRAAGALDAPVIRIPVNAARYDFRSKKEDYLLFLGRVSPWKGALEAAAFASAAGMRLLVAGPAWDTEYSQKLGNEFPDTVEFVGEVGGDRRTGLLSGAKALLAFSQPVPGPWGGIWSEPGATVVSEAAASGTPVIGSDNGCLAEIVPAVGFVVACGEAVTASYACWILSSLPPPEQVRKAAITKWGHLRIAREYENVYGRVAFGEYWR